MISRPFLTSLAAAPIALAGSLLHSAPATPPNIVLLFADDLGYGDIASYGCPDVKTPAIDSIGKRGARFTQFYANAPECSPSRTALLTGRYQQRVGGLECAIGIGNTGRYDEAEWLQKRGDLGLPSSETTLAEYLRRAGYDTAIIGKWHLGYEEKFWPNHHGFQESFVALGGAVDYVTHKESEDSPPLIHNGQPTVAHGYLTDVIADRALEWIAQRRKPYFLYLPFTAPHNPYQGPRDGPAPLPWEKQGSKREGVRDTYRQMIEHMDRRIGDILRAIERSPGADNTIVVFLSDNGGTGVGRNFPFRGFKGQLWEGGIRVPCVISWPREIPAGLETTQVALNMDLTATLLAAAGAVVPAERRLDGINLIDVLRGKTAPTPRTVFWRYKRETARRIAVREGDFKYVVDNGKKELLDLAHDPAETRNLLDAMPEKAAALAAKIAAWESDVVAPRLRDFTPASAAKPAATTK